MLKIYRNFTSTNNFIRLFPSYNHITSASWNEDGKTYLNCNDLIFPIFLSDNHDELSEINGFPKQIRVGKNKLCKYLEPMINNGLRSVLLFGCINENRKDINGTFADDSSTPVIESIQLIRKHFPQLFTICDVCLCAYVSSGACGIIDSDGTINVSKSIQRLSEISNNYAQAGCNCVAPSDMLDNRVAMIDQYLINGGVRDKVSIMSYSSKFSSCLYGPFREACQSNCKKSIKRFNQLPIGSSNLAIRAIARDINQGSDFIIVKPGSFYLDIVSTAKSHVAKFTPLIAYQVSGEYAMLYHAAKNGAIDLQDAVLESITCFKRAGCSAVVSYFTPQILEWIKTSA